MIAVRDNLKSKYFKTESTLAKWNMRKKTYIWFHTSDEREPNPLAIFLIMLLWHFDRLCKNINAKYLVSLISGQGFFCILYDKLWINISLFFNDSA